MRALKDKSKKIIPLSTLCKDLSTMLKENNHTSEERYRIALKISKTLDHETDLNDLIALLDLLRYMRASKGKNTRHFEKDLWPELLNAPKQLTIEIEGLKRSIIEIQNYDGQNKQEKELAIWVNFFLEILNMPEKKKSISSPIKSMIIGFFAYMVLYRPITDCDEIFKKFMHSKNLKEQLHALEGLSYYYDRYPKKLNKAMIKELDNIFHNTTERDIAVTCLEVQVNAGKLDEFEAACMISDRDEALEEG